MLGLVDTDVVYKSAIYGLLPSFCENPPSDIERIGVLTATRFVVAQKIKKKQSRENLKHILETLENQLAKIELMEPTEAETVMAESFEYFAAKANLNLDCGESQLCALLISRSLKAIFTGDKRAIEAMEALNKSEEVSGALNEKITCFEQMILWVLREVSIESVRASVCNNKGTDRALEICFSCTASDISTESVIEGLMSYIDDIEDKAPSVMNSSKISIP